MNLKKILAGAALAGSLAVGTAGIASAEATSSAPAKPTQEQLCQRAQTVWQRLKTLDERARSHNQKLVAARDKAAAGGNTELVAKIDARLTRVRDLHERIVVRMKELHDKGQGSCEIAEPDTSAL